VLKKARSAKNTICISCYIIRTVGLPYGGTREKPEAAWERDVELINRQHQRRPYGRVYLGDLLTVKQANTTLRAHAGHGPNGKAGIQVFLATPTARAAHLAGAENIRRFCPWMTGPGQT